MRLYNVYGKLVNKNVSKYVIDWDKKSRSKPQWATKQFFKPYWRGMIVYEEFPIFGSLLKMDLYNASLKIGIEVNGPHHEMFHYYHNGSPLNYLKQIKNDDKKLEWCERNDIQLICIKDTEVSELSKEFMFKNFGLIL